MLSKDISGNALTVITAHNTPPVLRGISSQNMWDQLFMNVTSANTGFPQRMP